MFLPDTGMKILLYPRKICSGLHGGPQKICPCPNPWNLWMWHYLEKKIFANVIELKIVIWNRSEFNVWALNSVTIVLTRERQRKIQHREQGRRPCKNGGRDWSYAATNQGHLELKAGRSKLGFSFRAGVSKPWVIEWYKSMAC